MKEQKENIPILIVSYQFPPRGGVGVQRIVKFVKYLPKHGFQPIVLTVKKPMGSVAEDEELIKEIPSSVKVIRTPSFEPYHIYRSLGGKRKQDDPAFRAELVAKARKRGFISGLYYEYQRRYLIPDPKIGWLKPALKAAVTIFEKSKPKVILSSSPEATSHLIALKLHEMYGVPFITDFRDPWTSGYYSLNRPKKAHQKELLMERQVLENAGAVTVVMKSFFDGFIKNHPNIAKDKFHIIPNGFDEADYANIKPEKYEHFTLAHTGSIYHQRSPEPLFKAIHEFLKKNPESKNDFRLLLLGQVDSEYFKMAVEIGISDVLIHRPFASHAESLSTQLGADALVLLSEGVMTAKVYEYLRAQKPVIGFAPDGELKDQVHDWGIGKIFSHDEPSKACDFIASMYFSWKQGNKKIWDEYKSVDLHMYERDYQASQISEILHSVLNIN